MKTILYTLLGKFQVQVMGPFYRNIGRKLYDLGRSIPTQETTQDRLVPSLRRLAHEGVYPDLQDADFVAPNATILGNVSLGIKSSIWYGATLIGTGSIKIGDNTVIQDRAHISKNVSIGNNVFVGPNTILQGSTLHDRAFVSMGSTIRRATVEKGGFVAAGAVVFDNSVVKEGEIWAGNPARFLRNVTPLERQVLREHLDQMQDLACMHSQQTQKSFKQIISEGEGNESGGDFEQFMNDPDEYKFGYTDYDMQYGQRRVMMKHKLEFPQIGVDYEPYRFQQKDMPQKFRLGIHDEQFTNVALKMKAKEQFQNSRDPWTSKY